MGSLKSQAITALAAFLGLAGPARAELSACKFNFGTSWQGPDYAYPAQIDYVTLWSGGDENFNVYWDGAMLNACKPGGKLAGRTPVYYAYIIAFTARRDLGLKDCDVGTPNLCQQGANFIRQKKDRILSQYAKYASETAKVWGTQAPIIWMMEPDYYQYFSDKAQEGGPLTFAEAGALMDEILATVKKSLPNAIFSLDISPWIANPTAWYGAFKMDAFAYINTSGGRTDADDARIRKENTMTWKSIHDLTHKPIIADDGYGVAGASTGHDATWDSPTNLNARIADGVVAITQASPRTDWNGIIAGVRGQLGKVDCTTGVRAGLLGSGPGITRAVGLPIGRDGLGRVRVGSEHTPILHDNLGVWSR
jgi:hypothetical protein